MARGADVARGTYTDTTRHARPRGRAARAHAARRWHAGAHRRRRRMAGATQVHADAWVAPHGRGHASPRGCLGGATWQGGWQVKGQRVIGPW